MLAVESYLALFEFVSVFKQSDLCDSVALTGTTFTGLVRTQYVLVPSVLLVYLPLTRRG